MKIAIDLEGTAFEWPQHFQAFIFHLLMGRAEIVFLTGTAGEFPPEHKPPEVKQQIAQRLPWLTEVRVACCEYREKGQWLRDNNFDLVIDDNVVEGWTGLQLIPRK